MISIKKFWGGALVFVGIIQGSYAVFKDPNLINIVLLTTFSTACILFGIKKFGGQGEQK